MAIWSTHRQEATCMKTRQLCIAMTAILFGVLAAQTAEAAPTPYPPPTEIPSSCSTVGKSQYTTGFIKGQMITQMAWNNVKNCDKIDYFLTVLYDNVSRFKPQIPPN